MWGWQLPRDEGGPDAPRELAPDLAPVAWRGRAVFIVYDSDLADNPGVAYAEWYAAEALTAKGATVKVVRLPHLPGGAKCGLDDYLVANGPDAFRGLLAAAVPPARPPGAASTADDALPPDEADDDPHRLARVYRAACRAARQVDGKTTWQDALVYHAEEYLRWSALLPDTGQQKILMIVGPKRSGKGTIARVLGRSVGMANVCAPTFSSLGERFGLQPLLGKTLGIVSDARLSGRTDAAVVVERLLSVSGEDAQTIDRKNLSPVTSRLTARFMILTNELPRLNNAQRRPCGPADCLAANAKLVRLGRHGANDALVGGAAWHPVVVNRRLAAFA